MNTYYSLSMQIPIIFITLFLYTDRFTSERSGTERNGRKRLGKRFSISLHAQTERNGMGNGMEWNETERNRMKQNETERNRTKQNETE